MTPEDAELQLAKIAVAGDVSVARARHNNLSVARRDQHDGNVGETWNCSELGVHYPRWRFALDRLHVAGLKHHGGMGARRDPCLHWNDAALHPRRSAVEAPGRIPALFAIRTTPRRCSRSCCCLELSAA
jgi:hypothetical protein